MFSNSNFLRDLGYHLKLAILLYADDTLLLSDTPEDLQLGLDGLDQYCKEWKKMQVNVEKTKIIILKWEE